MSSKVEFQLPAYPGRRNFTYPTAITADESELIWTSVKGSGTIAYREITAIELPLGDPDPGQWTGRCIISGARGQVLQVRCGSPAVYAEFVRFLHRQLSAGDRTRISFETDGNRTPKADRLIAFGYLPCAALGIGAFLVIADKRLAMGIAVGAIAAWFVYAAIVDALLPKSPTTYTPDPLDEKFLPR